MTSHLLFNLLTKPHVYIYVLYIIVTPHNFVTASGERNTLLLKKDFRFVFFVKPLQMSCNFTKR